MDDLASFGKRLERRSSRRGQPFVSYIYWEAEVKKCSEAYYQNTFGMTLREYVAHLKAEDVKFKTVTLPARRKEWASKAIEIEPQFNEPVEYFQAKSNQGEQVHGHFLTGLERLSTAKETPSIDKINSILSHWKRINVLCNFVEKYSQYLTNTVGNAKDIIAADYWYRPGYEFTVDTVTAEWLISRTVHALLESSEEHLADAIRRDAFSLEEETVFNKLNQVIELK